MENLYPRTLVFLELLAILAVLVLLVLRVLHLILAVLAVLVLRVLHLILADRLGLWDLPDQQGLQLALQLAHLLILRSELKAYPSRRQNCVCKIVIK